VSGEQFQLFAGGSAWRIGYLVVCCLYDYCNGFGVGLSGFCAVGWGVVLLAVACDVQQG
jgi:hypothetical protein